MQYSLGFPSYMCNSPSLWTCVTREEQWAPQSPVETPSTLQEGSRCDDHKPPRYLSRLPLTVLLSSRRSFGHLFRRCSSTPQVGGNQAGARRAASPSGGLKTSRGRTSGAMSAQKSKSRGWVVWPEWPVAFPFWINPSVFVFLLLTLRSLEKFV